MLWLAAHNLEINWETGEVKMMRCLPLYGERSPKKEKVKRVVTLEEEIKKDHRKIKELMLKL